MRPLLTLSAQWMLLATAIVLAMGVAAGLVRLLPWFVSPDVPLRLAAPFAEELGRRALEVALVVGLPVGASTAAALFVESGAARSLLALGASPARLACSVAAVGCAFVALGSVAGVTRTGDDSPRHFVTRLIGAGRAACETDRGTRRVDVPLVGAAWLCFAEGPRLVGRVPGVRTDFVFTASGVDENDASGFDLSDLRIAGRVEPAAATLRFRSNSAHVQGILGFGPGRSPLAGAARGAAISAVASLAAFLLAFVIVRHSISRPVHASCVAAGVALGLLLFLRQVDRWPAGTALPVAARSDR